MRKYLNRLYKRFSKSSLAKGTLVGILMKGGGLIFGQVFALLVGRIFGADEWGRLSLIIIVINLGAIIAKAGLDRGLLRIVSEYKGNDNSKDANRAYFSAIKIATIYSLVITLIAYFFAPTIAADIFNKPNLENAFKLAALGIIPLVLLQINAESLRGYKLIKQYAFLSYMSLHVFGSIIIAVLYFVSYVYNVSVVAYIISLYITCIISFCWTYNNFNYSYIIYESVFNKILLRLTRVSTPLLLANSLMFIKGWVDTFMLGIFMEESDVGIYNISLQLAKVVTVTLTAVNLLAAPLFAEYYGKKDFEGLQKAATASTNYIFCLSLPILAVFILFPKVILGIFGSEFTAGYISLIILSIGYFVNAITGSVGYIMQMTGRQVAFQNITLISTTIGVILNYILIPQLGILGAAISTLSSMVIWNWSCAVYLKVKMDLVTIFNPYNLFKR